MESLKKCVHSSAADTKASCVFRQTGPGGSPASALSREQGAFASAGFLI